MSSCYPALLLRQQLKLLQHHKTRRIPISSVTVDASSTSSRLRTSYSTYITRPIVRPRGPNPAAAPNRLPPQSSFSPCRGRPDHQRHSYSSVHASTLSFGQPVHETHPHLLAPGELTPGIPALEYHERRAKLASRLPQNGVAILAAADVKYRSGSVFYEYKQDTDFMYLTGWNEPESLAVIERLDGTGREDGADYRFWMFVRPKDKKAEQWEGARSGIDAARDVWNADEAHDISTLKDQLPSILTGASEIHTDVKLTTSPNLLSRLFSTPTPQSDPISKILSSNSTKPKLRPLRPLMNQLRIIKSPHELSLLRLAGQASGRAFNTTLSQTPSFRTERHLDNHLHSQLLLQGCETIAFEPVVACGPAALSIHYVRNDLPLSPDRLVLVDAGGEHSHYISDITRTVPVSLRFSPPQRDLYTAILTVQKDCISLCRASAHLSLDALHAHAEQSLRQNLTDLGFDVSGSPSTTMNDLFPHHLSHYIGMDVHDCPGYPRKEDLRPGMCVTIEPGIYVPADDGDRRFPERFRGMGIRIEDSVLVGKEEAEVLTADAVKEVDQIEALRE